MLHHNPGQAQEVENLSVSDAKEYIDTSEGDHAFTILDVRTPEEYAEGHIPGAALLNFNDPDFAANLDALPKDSTYLVYCRSGNRSAKAADLMRAKGFGEVLNMQGGMMDWQDEGFPVEKGAEE